MKFPRQDKAIADFEAIAAKAIASVLDKHGISFAGFQPLDWKVPAWGASFRFNEREHELLIADKIIQMEQGKSLFEPYHWRRDDSLEQLVDEFSARLDRYLSGEPWNGPPR